MSEEYLRVNLEDMVDTFGENIVKDMLADFSCPLNLDVEKFLREKAIEFSKQSIAKTQLIYKVIEDEEQQKRKTLVGYFSLAQKTINVSKSALNRKNSGRLKRFARFDHEKKCYVLPVILIGQMGKNYKDKNNLLIDGSELLEFTLQSITLVQKYIGGKFVYLESEEKDKLIDFYKKNGFSQFGKRKLDGDETDLVGEHLVQWIRYMGK